MSVCSPRRFYQLDLCLFWALKYMGLCVWVEICLWRRHSFVTVWKNCIVILEMLCFLHPGKADGAPMCKGFCAGDHYNSTLSACTEMYMLLIFICMCIYVCVDSYRRKRGSEDPHWRPSFWIHKPCCLWWPALLADQFVSTVSVNLGMEGLSHLP